MYAVESELFSPSFIPTPNLKLFLIGIKIPQLSAVGPARAYSLWVFKLLSVVTGPYQRQIYNNSLLKPNKNRGETKFVPKCLCNKKVLFIFAEKDIFNLKNHI